MVVALSDGTQPPALSAAVELGKDHGALRGGSDLDGPDVGEGRGAVDRGRDDDPVGLQWQQVQVGGDGLFRRTVRGKPYGCSGAP